MMGKLLPSLAAACLLVGFTGSAGAAAEGVEIPEHAWSFSGVFGTYDRAELQRGFQVYREVCASCHGLRLVSFRDLASLGYGEEEIKAIAAQSEVIDGPNDEGELFQRPALPSDRLPSPFPNDQAARAAQGGALPPDLSLIAKARAAGPDYLRALLLGYEEPPAGFEVPPGQYYNRYFGGHLIAMPPPLSDGAVTYAGGAEATVEAMATDVAHFLMWAAEPKLEARKQTGMKVMLFLLVFTGLMYALKRKVWAGVP